MSVRGPTDVKIIVFGSYAPSLLNFRGALLRSLVSKGVRTTVMAPMIGNDIRDVLSLMGVDWIEVNLARTSLNPFGDLRTLAELVRIFRRERPSHILSYTIKPVVYGTLAARVVGVPYVYVMITGLGYSQTDSHTFLRKLLSNCVRGLYRLSLKNAAAIFFQNPDDLTLFRDDQIINKDTPTVLTNGSGVDLAHFKEAPLPDTPRFLMIARLLKGKGVHEFADAARKIQKSGHNVSFSLVGWLDESPDVIDRSVLDGWASEGVLNYLGKMEDVRPAIANCSVYVLPSYREGTPRTVLEAMAMGRPVITTDVPGCRETVVEGVNGFLVPPRDAQALAGAMQRFIDDPGLIPKMGAESRRLADEKYDVHKVNRVILDAMGMGMGMGMGCPDRPS